MLPPTDVLLEAARSARWHAVLGIRAGTKLSPKQMREFRAHAHPDRGHSHEVSTAVAQALEEIARNDPLVVSSPVERLIEECSRAVRFEAVNSAGGRELRRILDALADVTRSTPRLQYYCKGWGKQAGGRCYAEILRIWPAYEEQINCEPLRAHEIGLQFLAQAAEIDAFQDSLTVDSNRIWYAQSWVVAAEQQAQCTPVAARRRKTEAQRSRRSARRNNLAKVSEVEALVSVLEHCEFVEDVRCATPLGDLRRALLNVGIAGSVLLAAGISSKTRRQHRPLCGEPFYYATLASNGKRSPIRLKETFPANHSSEQ